MANTQDRRFACQNFVFSQDLLRLTEWKTWGSSFARAAFISYLFLPRAPSETIRRFRLSNADPILKFGHQNQKAIIGIRRMEDNDVLAVKFRLRETFGAGAYSFAHAFAQKHIGRRGPSAQYAHFGPSLPRPTKHTNQYALL